MELEVLEGLLNKAYRIEVAFENEVVFKAFIDIVDAEQKDVIFKLMADSERHKKILEKIAQDLNLKLEKPEKITIQSQRIFNEIYKLELDAKYIYERIVEKFAIHLKNHAETLRHLAKEEEMHAKMVEKFVDKTLRII